MEEHTQKPLNEWQRFKLENQKRKEAERARKEQRKELIKNGTPPNTMWKPWNEFVATLVDPEKTDVQNVINKYRPRQIFRVAKWWALCAMIPLSIIFGMVFMPWSVMNSDQPEQASDFIISIIFGGIFLMCILVIPWMIIVPRRLIKNRINRKFSESLLENPSSRETHGYVIEREVMFSVSTQTHTGTGGTRNIANRTFDVRSELATLYRQMIYVNGLEKLIENFSTDASLLVGDKLIVRFDPNNLKFVKIVEVTQKYNAKN